jgi:hypothetical protein
MKIPVNLLSYYILMLYLLFTISACEIRVEKLGTHGINGRFFLFDPSVAAWQDSVFRLYGNGEVVTNSGDLDKGAYEIRLTARGTQAGGQYPSIKVALNSEILKDIHLDSGYVTYRIPFLLEKKKDVEVDIYFDQDAADKSGNDRDVLIRSCTVDTISGDAPGNKK